jgi:hypothetical protein
MLHEIGGNQIDPFWISDERLKRCPLRLEPFFARQLFAFGDFFELFVDLWQFACVQAELGDAALIVDRNSRFVGDRSLDVVDADVIAEDGARICIRLFDWCAGEANERGVRQ